MIRALKNCLVLVVATFFLSMALGAHTGSGIAVDRFGQVFFLDTGSGLWKIDTLGRLTRLSTLRNHWLALDAANRFTGVRLSSGGDGEITAIGTNPTVLISTDFPIAVGKDEHLYYQAGRPGQLQITRTIPSGEKKLYVALPSTTTGKPLPHLNGIIAGPDSSIYYTEDSSIRRISVGGKISTVATVPALVGGPSIPGTNIHPYLRGLDVDSKGVMYVADNGDARVLRITPEGKISTLLQLESPWSPTGVAIFGDIVYVLEFLHTEKDDRLAWLPRVRKITPDGKSTIIATIDRMPGAR